MGLGDHPKTFLLKALCCQSTPSPLKVRGWVGGGWWPRAFYCQHWDWRVSILDSRFSILYSPFYSQVPSPSPSRLTILSDHLHTALLLVPLMSWERWLRNTPSAELYLNRNHYFDVRPFGLNLSSIFFSIFYAGSHSHSKVIKGFEELTLVGVGAKNTSSCLFTKLSTRFLLDLS